MDQSQFEQAADSLLEDLMDRIDDALGDQMDVDLEGGILTIELDTGGQYVINKHGPNRQVWMSSPKSGATHYDFDGAAGVWACTRTGASLTEVLAGELASASGRAFDLNG
ncbi:MAG: iron donor protein CyaY [Rhodospirillaceae bacterium]